VLWSEHGLWANDTVTNYYNSGRMRSGLGLAQPTGSWTNGFTYDAGHRLATVISPVGTFTYTYKGPGNLVTNLALPNGSRITNAFDTVGRLTSTRLLTSGNSLLNSHAYLYNLASQRTQQTRTDASTVTYTYDNIGQLKSAVGSGGQSTENLGYLYDTAWNLNKRTNNGTPTTFGVNVKNELTSGPNGTCSYDYNGNLSSESSGPVRTFTYDDENQLTAVVWGTGSYRTEFTYDGRGRMRKRLEKYYSGGQWTATSTNYYVYDGMRVIQERNNLNTPSVGYTRGNDLSGSLEGAGGIGGLLGRSDTYSGGSFTRHHGYHADGNGNVTALVDSAQASAASYRYNPYGGLLGSSGGMAGANVYRFSSKEWFQSLGLYYYGYRFYDPNLQRWLNRDPLGEKGGINLYGFLDNKPLISVDPFGLADYSIPPLLSPKPPYTIPPTNPPGLVMPPGGGAGAPGGMPPGSTGPGNLPVIKPQPCKVNSKRNVDKFTFTCPCTMKRVPCEKGEICKETGVFAPSSGVNGPPVMTTFWEPYRKCEPCPEGYYDSYPT